MEYLKTVHDDLKKINENNIEYLNIFEHPELIYGTINYGSTQLDFSKFPKTTRDEMKKFGKGAVREMENFYNTSSGNRLRFKTNSKEVIFKIKLKRKWDYKKLVNWNAMGFDIYEIINEKYIHKGIFGPKSGENTFAQKIVMPRSGEICIFLPNYNTIEEFYLGLKKGSYIKPFDYPYEKRLPVLFYGNSITQGAAASRSSNSFPNIVSKKLNRDIINLSVSSGCRGTESMADTIGKINCHSIIIDYTRNASTLKEFKNMYGKFYERIRYYHPEKKIILMTSASFNEKKMYKEFDAHIMEIYEKAKAKGENTELLNQTQIFDKEDYDLVTVDEAHFIDWSMNEIADKICELIRN